MTRSQKVLGKVAPIDSSLTTLYTAPTGKTTLVSNITVTNRDDITEAFDITFNKAGSTPQQHALFFASDNDNGKGNISSTDGINWKSFDYSELGSSWINFVASDGTIYTSYEYTGQSYTSKTEGNSWVGTYSSGWSNGYNVRIREIFPSSAVSYNKYAVVYNDDNEGSAICELSTDLITWTNSSYFDGHTDAFAYGNGIFASFNQYSQMISVSSDGFATYEFYEAPLETYDNLYNCQNSFIFANNLFIYCDQGNNIAYSTDAINWSTSFMDIDYGPDGFWNQIEYQKVNGQDRYVIFEDGEMYVGLVSTDLITWETFDLPKQGAWYDKGFTSAKTENGPIFVAMGDYEPSVFSTDGYTWSMFGIATEGWWITTSAQVPNYIEPKTSLYSNLTLNPLDFIVLEPGIICGPGDSISVRNKNNTTNLTFSVYGVELS